MKTVDRSIAIAICLALTPVTHAQSAAPNAEERAELAHISEDQIVAIKARIVRYRAIIAEQRQAARISGYVDKEAMYSAGMMISRDGSRLNQEYVRYRSLGGRKLLAQIHAGPSEAARRAVFDY